VTNKDYYYYHCCCCEILTKVEIDVHHQLYSGAKNTRCPVQHKFRLLWTCKHTFTDTDRLMFIQRTISRNRSRKRYNAREKRQ